MTASQSFQTSPISATAGVGLRLAHLGEIALQADDAPHSAAWLEIHSETFLNAGGARLAMLQDVRRRYALSCHGVGLSLGSAQGLDPAHLKRLKHLFDRVQPALISEHLAWSVVDGAYLNDLLPLPYTDETLAIVSANVSRAQDYFGRRMLIENPSSYLSFTTSSMPEWEFLAGLVKNTDCGLLLDINNIFVSAANNDFNAEQYLSNVTTEAVGEIHLAGHSIEGEGDECVLIDTHSTYVCDPVWELYRATIARIGARPTLIEWDMDIPALTELQREAARAQVILDKERTHVA